MSVFYTLPNSTYAGYKLIIPKIEYISRVNFRRKMNEYSIDIGYNSKDFTKYTLIFSSEEEALVELDNLEKAVEEFFKK